MGYRYSNVKIRVIEAVNSIILKNIGSLISYNTCQKKVISYSNIEIAIENDKIIEIGKNLGSCDNIIDCKSNIVTPGFVDPHTHPVFVNRRNNEFIRRIAGESYEKISLDGGGIINNIQELRDVEEHILFDIVKRRMDTFLKMGTTTIEAKSGYGLDTDSELKSLSVLKKVSDNHAIDIVPTFMGAHTFPNEFLENKNGFVDLICDEMIPAISDQGIAVFNDVFCEKGYFSPSQAKRILNVGKKYGLQPRLHADEFSNSNAAKLAAEVKAVSADHLMAVSDEGIIKMAKNNVIGILLPGTTFSLGRTNYAPFVTLREKGVEIAIATDFNPGSCFIKSMPFIMSLSCIYMKVPILEALKACTYTAAKSLGLHEKIGSIEQGKNADILIWNFDDINLIPSHFLPNPISKVIKDGNLILQLD